MLCRLSRMEQHHGPFIEHIDKFCVQGVRLNLIDHSGGDRGSVRRVKGDVFRRGKPQQVLVGKLVQHGLQTACANGGDLKSGAFSFLRGGGANHMDRK